MKIVIHYVLYSRTPGSTAYSAATQGAPTTPGLAPGALLVPMVKPLSPPIG